MYFYIQNNLYSNNETEAQETDYFAVKMFSHSKINSIKNLKHHNTVAGDVSNEKNWNSEITFLIVQIHKG